MKEYIKMVREALEIAADGGPVVARDELMQEALTALDAIEQAMREPVSWVNPKTGTAISDKEKQRCATLTGGMNHLQGQNDDGMKAYAAAHTEPCFAAPPAQQAQAEAVPQWIDPSDKVPEDGQECLVWSHHHWEKAPSVKMDTWQEQHEAPLSFSSATIPVGVGWDAHNFEDVIAWMPLPAAPQPKDTK